MRLTQQIWIWLGALCIVGSVSTQARSEDASEMISKGFEHAMRSGSLDTLLDRYDGNTEFLSASPKIFDAVMQTAEANVARYASQDPTAWKRLAKMLQDAYDAVYEASDAQIASVRCGLASVRLQVGAASGAPFVEKEWSEAAQQLKQLSKSHPAEGRHLMRAIQLLRCGAALGGKAGTPLHVAMLKVLDEGSRRFPANSYFLEGRYSVRLQTIKDLYPVDRRKAVKMFKGYVASLDAPTRNNIARDSAYNDAVTFARRNRGLGKPKYRTTTMMTQHLSFQVPISSRWKSRGSRITRVSGEGLEGLTFKSGEYRWDVAYQIGAKNVGGDNLKGLARANEEGALEHLSDVKFRRKTRRGRLSKKVSAAVFYVIGGLDLKSTPITIREYYYKSKRLKMRSVALEIFQYGQAKKMDPELAFVLSTARER